MIRRTVTSKLISMAAGAAMIASAGCHKTSKESPLTDQQKWALATSAIPKKVNDMALNALGGGEDFAEAAKEMLKDDWDITDRRTALDAIKSLKEQGHRQEFNGMLKEVAHVSQREFGELLKGQAGQPEVQKQLELVYSKKDAIGKKSIVAWDYCRLVYVAECCSRAGYLTEQEAWQEITSAAKVIQSTFSSWQEMSDNYLLGREFWSGSREPRMTVAAKVLLSDKNSPWVKFPWALPLTEIHAR